MIFFPFIFNIFIQFTGQLDEASTPPVGQVFTLDDLNLEYGAVENGEAQLPFAGIIGDQSGVLQLASLTELVLNVQLEQRSS